MVDENHKLQSSVICHKSLGLPFFLDSSSKLRFSPRTCVYLHVLHVPSGKLTVCYWNLPFIVDLPIKNVFFHGYVSLPEGIPRLKKTFQCKRCCPLTCSKKCEISFATHFLNSTWSSIQWPKSYPMSKND